jgi:hypothetical protein
MRPSVFRTFLVSFVVITVSQGHGMAQEDAIFKIYDIDSTTGLDLGRGFNILTLSPRNQCVVIQKTVEHPEYGPSEVAFRSYRIENSEQLDKALGVSASASASWGVASGSASASFSSAISVSSYSLSYVVDSSVQRKGPSVQVQDLQERYRKLLASGNPDAYRRFRAICGDGYIAEMPMGGIFKAVIHISTKSRAESEAISASLSASYAGISGAASLTSSLKELAKTNEVEIWSLRKGGEGPVAITPDEIAKSAAELPVSAKAAPVPLQVAVFSYLGVLDDPMLPLETFSERAAQIERLASLSAAVRDQWSDAKYILEHPAQFYGQPEDVIKLTDEIQALVNFRLLVSARAEDCVRSDGSCLVDDLSVPIPTARPARR